MKAAGLLWLLLFSPLTAAGAEVVIESDRLQPRTLETLTGERVNFVNRTGRPVHLQL